MEDVAATVGLIAGATVIGVLLGLLFHFTVLKRKAILGTLIAGAVGSAIGRLLPLDSPGWIRMLGGAFVLLLVWSVIVRKRAVSSNGSRPSV